jgi:hypothetical protein
LLFVVASGDINPGYLIFNLTWGEVGLGVTAWGYSLGLT